MAIDRKILLHWGPPASPAIPSPPMSVLKAHLYAHGYSVEICYWNLYLLDLQNQFLWGIYQENDINNMFLYFAYLAVQQSDNAAYQRIKYNLKGMKPQYINVDVSFFDEHIRKYVQQLDEKIEQKLDAIDFSQLLYVGLSVNLYQWVFSSILVRKIKSRYPDLPIIIGGIGTKEEAMAYLDNFPQFDIALFGEGESHLLAVSDKLSCGDTDFSTIGNIVYRKDGQVVSSGLPVKEYVDLSDLHPMYDDYFQQKQDKIEDKLIMIPIENSRSCHWKKCHFCYLNVGYKYRVKSIQAVIDEILSVINRYHVATFGFLDNDIIGLSLERFNLLLDELIRLRSDFPEFNIIETEIITKGIDAGTIKKMALAGIKHVQIGYESPSNHLLQKIDKKNTFCSNLLFLKFASAYHMTIGGANVIRGLLEETDEDIYESIDNLHYLRFFLRQGFFTHSISQLSVTHSSRYFKQIQKQAEMWQYSMLLNLLPKDFIIEKNKVYLLEQFSIQLNSLWNLFANIEIHYLKNHYYYQLLKCRQSVIFTEYYNGEPINVLEIELDSPEFKILQLADKQVVSKDELVEYLHLPEGVVVKTLENLQQERIIFCTEDYSENVSIICLDFII